MFLSMKRFCVNSDMRLFTKAFAQPLLDKRGAVVSLVKRDTAVHTHMHFNGNTVADAPCAQVVRLMHVRQGEDDALYLLFCLFRK